MSAGRPEIALPGEFEPFPVVHAEKLVLRALCQGTPEGSVRETAKSNLATYHWREPFHQAVFSALLSLPVDNPQFIRAQLPRVLTRKGFPNFDLDELFMPHGLSKPAVERLIELLAGNG